MKLTLYSISFLVVLVNSTLVDYEAYSELLERLETCIKSFPDILKFEFKIYVVKDLYDFPDSCKNDYIDYADEYPYVGKAKGPAKALIATINKIFEKYKTRSIVGERLELLNTIRSVDPIGFIIFTKFKDAANYGEAIENFQPIMMDRQRLLQSKTNSSYESISAEILEEVATERTILTDSSINFFRDIANRHLGSERMIDVTVYEVMEFIMKYGTKEHDDIQILYGGQVGLKAIGHWICTQYKSSDRKVHVYDSLGKTDLTKEQMEIIRKLYPKKFFGCSVDRDIVYEKTQNIQNDSSSCGLFAIFYATTLLLGQNPEHIPIKMNRSGGDAALYLRLHVLEMFANGKLAPFPEEKN